MDNILALFVSCCDFPYPLIFSEFPTPAQPLFDKIFTLPVSLKWVGFIDIHNIIGIYELLKNKAELN
jgi:hypothetical protein